MKKPQTGKTREARLNEHSRQPRSTSVQKEEQRPVKWPQQHSTPKLHLHDFLCQRHGIFDAQMHAWLHCIGSDDEVAESIRLETGHLPPAVQLAQHCAEQALQKEMVEKPGFAQEFWHAAQQSCSALWSRLMRAWIGKLMDFAQAQVSLHEAHAAMAEILDTLPALAVTLSKGEFPPTLNLNISFEKAAEVGVIEGKGRVVKRGRDVCVSQGSISSW